MRRNGHKTTSGVKFDSIFEHYVPDSYMTIKLEIEP